jgi:hypothetical protein
MAYEVANAIQALAVVNAAAAAPATPPVLSGYSPGFNPAGVGADHSAVGVYVLALDEPIKPAEAVYIATPATGGVSPNTNIAVSPDAAGTLITVITSIGGAPDDTVGFSLEVLRKPS